MASKHAQEVARAKAHAAKKAGVSSSSKLAKATTKKSGIGDTSSQYSALMKKYQKTLTPSKTETKATKQLGDITTAGELGVAKQGQEVMPMDLITGAQRAITEQTSLKSAPLSRLIASEQAKRGAASDVLSAQSALLKEKMSAESAAATEAQKQRDVLAQIAARKSGGGGTQKLQSVQKKVGRNTIFGTYNPSTGEYSWQE